jgi:hypothetical protein
MNLTLQYDKALFILEPNEVTRPLARQRVTVFDYPDGRLAIKHKGRDLPYRVFDKRQQINQAAVVENKRLGPVLAYIAERQKELDLSRSKKAPRRRGQAARLFNRHPPDDRLRWAEIAAMGGHWQARTVAPSSLQGLPSAKSVTPALSASEMSISRSSRRTSPLVLADTHDSRTPHAGAGSGGGRSCEISRRISANSILGTATSAIWKAT